ncbi:MAG: endonuclease III domain-containing protein [Candidatus Omnitrophica bacterium]|nr:endonuclease III domain-containing protein [Candidatus Omnitrophota bacterium]
MASFEVKTGLRSFYKKLYAHFGPQHWWPAGTPFEVMLGAILTQNTSWHNVEKAIANLRKNSLLEPLKLYRLSPGRLGALIKPAGYYNVKARRLKAFLSFLFESYKGKLKNMYSKDTQELRQELVSVNGIGFETADSILLYALEKPIFVVDTYTKRILLRHRFIKEDSSYQEVQNLFMQNLKNDVKLFNEYHALLVKLGKDFCLKRKPKCEICPLK